MKTMKTHTAALETGTEAEKIEAADAVGACDLTRGDKDKEAMKARDAAREAGAIPLLIKIARDAGNEKLQETAVRALANIGFEHHLNLGAISAAGAIPALVEVLRNGTDKAKTYSAELLGFLGTNDSDYEKIVAAGAIDLLVALYGSDIEHGKYIARTALAALGHSDQVLAEPITAENAALNAKVAAVESANTELDATVLALESENAKLEATVAELEATVAAVESEKAPLESANAKLESEKAAVEKANTKLEATVKVLARDTVSLESKTAALESTIAALETGNTAQGSTIAALKAELESRKRCADDDGDDGERRGKRAKSTFLRRTAVFVAAGLVGAGATKLSILG